MFPDLLLRCPVKHQLDQVARLLAEYPAEGEVVMDDGSLASRRSPAIGGKELKQHLLPEHASKVSSLPPPPRAVNPRPSKPSNQPLVRAWFHVPSIGVRAARIDIVFWAERFSLAGLILGGRPGVLCVEGPSDRVDAYMRTLNSECLFFSNRGMTERMRERIGRRRAFAIMEDVTAKVIQLRDEAIAREGDDVVITHLGVMYAYLEWRGMGGAFLRAAIV